MSEETLNLETLSLEDDCISFDINAEMENSGIGTSSHTKTLSRNRKHHITNELKKNYLKKFERFDDVQNKAIGCKRKHEREESREEQIEKMARLMIEDCMSSALIRRCWKCERMFVKEGECTAVRCECGATTCFVCGQFIANNNLVTAHLGCAPYTTPGEDRERVRGAAERAKRALRATHPSLTFKYDPSDLEDSDVPGDCSDD